MMNIQDLDPRTGPAKIPLAALRGWLAALLPFLDELPACVLRPRDRRDLAGFGFLEGTLVCYLLERALRQAPELFPELNGELARLEELGARAGLWLCLRGALRAALDRVEDQYLLARRERVGRSLELLRYYRQQAARQPPGVSDPQAERKRDLLAPAQWAVSAWQDRIHRRRRRR